jgi:hypothetical protein
MAWTSPWEPEDPVEKKRRELKAEAARLAAEAAALEEKLQLPPEARSSAKPREQYPVWRAEEESRRSGREPVKRQLRAQRQQDRNLFMLLAFVLLVIVFFVWRHYA